MSTARVKDIEAAEQVVNEKRKWDKYKPRRLAAIISRRRCKGVCLCITFTFFFLFFVLLMVIVAENKNLEDDVHSSPISPLRCGFDGQTFSDFNATVEANTTVLHCGNCGKCSNQNDMGIYWETREELTKAVTKCAVRHLFLGEESSRKCMKDKVGFTDQCNECWLDNIDCSTKKCRLPCLKTMVGKWFGMYEPPEGNPTYLDPCLKCDEVKCGPAFKECAGANRRRSSIPSDIERPSNEICSDADLSWVPEAFVKRVDQ